jgi:hypothetical protein
MPESNVIDELSKITLALTVTSGRSGTMLLKILLSDALGLAAEHEPKPRVNFVLRTILTCPGVARDWLFIEKLPIMLSSAKNGFYAETSHLFCKGLIEPLLSLGVRPKLIALTRPAREVASSLYQMNVIPCRTEAGRVVLLGPCDPDVLPLPSWSNYSDYQLCYWYVREIERRQAHYAALSAEISLDFLRVSMQDLATAETLTALANFCGIVPGPDAFTRQREIVAKNRHTRLQAAGVIEDRPLPADLGVEEEAVDAVIPRGLSSFTLLA